MSPKKRAELKNNNGRENGADENLQLHTRIYAWP
jgi:hypothetical protein